MGFFGSKKKKTENVKILSETEIQQRLYGHLRVPSTGVEDPSAETSRQSATSTIRRPASAETSKDVFVQKSAQPSETLKIQETSSHKTFSSPTVSGAGFSQKSGWNESSSANTVVKAKVEKPKNTGPGFFAKAMTGLKNISIFILLSLAKLIGALFHFIFSIDFRKPGVRRVATGIAAGAFIAFLFFGTHLLNVGREHAMKTPRQISAPIRTTQTTDGSVEPPKTTPVVPGTPTADAKKTPVRSAPTDQPQSKKAIVDAQNVAKPKPTEPGGFSIQIATFATQEDAGRLVTKLNTENADAFVKQMERPGGKTYFCVFVGHYKTYREAEENLNLFKKRPQAKPFQDAFARALKLD